MKLNYIRILGTALALTSVLGVRAMADETPLLQMNGQALYAIRDGDTICVGFRDLCEAAGYQVRWGDGTAIAEGETTISVRPGERFIHAGDESYNTKTEILLINGRTVLPVRDLAQVLDMNVQYDAATGSAVILLPQETPEDTPHTPDAEYKPDSEDKPEFGSPGQNERPPAAETDAPDYSEEDLYWLARIIEAEAGAEEMTGKIAVGNVVLNRVSDPNYPETIYDVIFDTQYGIQFEPTSNGTIYNNPSQASIDAAKRALEGENVIGQAIYFYNPSMVDAVWIRTNCTYLQTIGCHDFYV